MFSIPRCYQVINEETFMKRYYLKNNFEMVRLMVISSIFIIFDIDDVIHETSNLILVITS